MKSLITYENTVEQPTKIESKVSFSDTVRVMRSKKQDTELKPTPEQLSSMEKNLKTIEDYEHQKKAEKDYLRLKRNLEAHREARPVNPNTTREENHIAYWQQMIESTEASLQRIQQELDTKLQALRNKYDLEIKKKQDFMTSAKARKEKVEQELAKQKKTKEELRLEKELLHLVTDFKDKYPDKDTEYYFPGYKALLSEQLSIQATAPAPTPAPPPPPPPIQQEEEEEPEPVDFTKMTAWQRYLHVNEKSNKSIYDKYHDALNMGITPDIPEPEKPVPKRRSKTTATLSRNDLGKILPQYT